MARQDSFQKKWASSPSQFERPADALITRGWAGGASEDPPEAKWENWWHNRVDEVLAEVEATGAPKWFTDVPYKAGATVNYSGGNWLALLDNEGVQPGGSSDSSHWLRLVPGEQGHRVAYVSSVAGLESITGTAGQQVDVAGCPFKYDGANWSPIGPVNIKAFGAVADGVTSDSAAIESANATGNTIRFTRGQYRIDGHVIITSPIIVEPGASFVADWTTTSWLTIYKNGPGAVLPEWFGAIPDAPRSATKANTNAAAIQAAMDCAIDISIDPIGVQGNPNHGNYNSIALAIQGHKDYYIGANELRIRSEHHFIGMYIFDPAMSTYNGGIVGDKTANLFFIETPDVVGDIGAQTCKTFERVSLRSAVNAIEFEQRSDQSLYVKGCRFGEITGACLKATNIFNLSFTDNYFGDCANGWLVDLFAVNACSIINNVTGESANPSKGIRVQGGNAHGGNTIMGNRLRSGYLIVEEYASSELSKHTVIGNTVHAARDTYFPYAMYIDTLESSVVAENSVDFGTKSGSEDFEGIRLRQGRITGGMVTGTFDIGIRVLAGGSVDVPVNGANIGIHWERALADSTPCEIRPTLTNCATGIYCSAYEAKILGGKIEGSTLGIDGGSNFRYGLIESVTFKGNATDFTIFDPGSEREGEITVLKDCLYPDAAETHKIRQGIDKLAVVTGIHRTTAPSGGTWKAGDLVMTGGGIYRCTASGTPGTWAT